MPATDRDLLALVDTTLGAGARRAGVHLACRTGCTPCCHGPFPIHALDAWRLRQGLEALRARDPAAAEGIAARARREVAVLAGAFPGDPGTGVLGADDAAEEAWCERHRDRPCPALEPGTGRCLLYEARPLSCRTFGLPVRLDGEDLPACTLCFRGAASSEVEACRVTVDAGEIEAEIARHHGLEEGETAIAWVLAAPEFAASAIQRGMFVVLLTYQRPLPEIDRRMRAHVAFLEEGYRAGVFLASGRQVPRQGGVILAVSPGRQELQAWMERDPFVREGLARFEIVEFRTSLHHPALAAFADPGTRAVRDLP